MAFIAYPSIYNLVDFDFVQRILRESIKTGDREWIVLEKCHGCNIQILVTPDGIRLGSRSQYIDDFKGVLKMLAEEMEPALRRIVEKLGTESLRFYGELYSGCKKIVGKQIPYCKDVKIGIFDVLKPDGSFVSWDTLTLLLKQEDLHYFPELARGSLKDMLLYAADHAADPTTLSDGHTKEVPIREGVVIKSVEPFILSNGSRAILKHKSPAHTETKVKLSPDQLHSWMDLLTLVRDLVNDNRVASLLSKHVEPKEVSMGDLITEFRADVLKDLLPQVPESLMKYVETELLGKIDGMAAYLIKEGLAEIE